MAKSATAVKTTPLWVDLSSKDVPGSRAFYEKLFGWKVRELGPDAGGYVMLQVGGKDVVGLGPTQMAEQPTAWAVYIGTDDADAIAKKVEKAGGTVIAPPFDVMEQGRMGTFQDPGGAFISVWQPIKFSGPPNYGKPNTPGWWELNARGVASVKPFYRQVFGWSEKLSEYEAGMTYTEFQLEGHSIAGAMEMADMVPAEVPNHWLVYFTVTDVDATAKKAAGLGARVAMQPSDYPGGRYAVIIDPQGAAFGLMSGS